jgi:hypothetical protein
MASSDDQIMAGWDHRTCSRAGEAKQQLHECVYIQLIARVYFSSPSKRQFQIASHINHPGPAAKSNYKPIRFHTYKTITYCIVQEALIIISFAHH